MHGGDDGERGLLDGPQAGEPLGEEFAGLLR